MSVTRNNPGVVLKVNVIASVLLIAVGVETNYLIFLCFLFVFCFFSLNVCSVYTQGFCFMVYEMYNCCIAAGWRNTAIAFVLLTMCL